MQDEIRIVDKSAHGRGIQHQRLSRLTRRIGHPHHDFRPRGHGGRASDLAIRGKTQPSRQQATGETPRSLRNPSRRRQRGCIGRTNRPRWQTHRFNRQGRVDRDLHRTRRRIALPIGDLYCVAARVTGLRRPNVISWTVPTHRQTVAIPLIRERTRAGHDHREIQCSPLRQRHQSRHTDNGGRRWGSGGRWRQRRTTGVATIELIQVGHQIIALIRRQTLHKAMRLRCGQLIRVGDQDPIQPKIAAPPP